MLIPQYDVQVEAGGSVSDHTHDAASTWTADAARLEQTFLTKQGLDVGRCNLLLHVRPCEGLMRQLDGSVEKRFSKAEILYPIQVRASVDCARMNKHYTPAAAHVGM